MRLEALPRRLPRVVGGTLLTLGGIAAVAASRSAGASSLAVGCGYGACPGSDAIPLSTLALIGLLSVVAAVALGVLVYLVGWGSSRRRSDAYPGAAPPEEPAYGYAAEPPDGHRPPGTARRPQDPSDLDEMMDELERASIDGQEGGPQ
jgi:hypothetical protein